MIRHDAAHWLRRARREGWALGMFNAHHLEAVQAIAEAAALDRAPVMLGTTMGGLRHVGLDYFVAMAGVARGRTEVPLILHLDHGADLATVAACIAAGFDSVMIDGSARDEDANIGLAREVIALARRHGVAVEAQVGATPGEEGEGTEERRTTPEEAARFVERTGVDALAVSVGSTPGRVGTGAEIDADLVASIGAVVPVPLVLHGGTSVPDASVRASIRGGVAKVNIDAAVKAGFREALRRHYGRADPVVDTRVPLAEARERARDAVRAKLALFGSIGRAA